MKLLLVIPNYHCGGMEAIQGPMMNLGPLFVASAAIKNGHKIKFLDLTIENKNINDCIQEIEEFSPDIVGVAARTHLVNEAIRITKFVKNKYPHVLTLMGGIHATFMYNEIMEQHDEVDFIIRHEGEQSLTLLLNAIENGDDFTLIPNLVWRKGKIVVNCTTDTPIDLNKHRPAYELVPDWNKYRNHFSRDLSAVVQFSRGCIQKCSYCSQWKFWNTWHSCSPEVFADEIEMLYKKYNIRYFLLADESPQIDAELWEKVLDELIKRNLKGAYFGTCARVKDILRDKDIMDKYRRAGFMIILFGAEFTSNKTLNSVLKEQKFDEIKSAVELIKSNGMVSIVDIMLGWNNDEAEFYETLNDIPKLNADFVCYFWTTPYPWTKSYDELTKRFNLDNNYENYNFMNFFGNNFDQKIMEKELIKSYFSYHFRPKYIYKGLFTGPKEKRRIFRGIFLQGFKKSFVQLYPVMRHVLQRKEIIPTMHYPLPDKK